MLQLSFSLVLTLWNCEHVIIIITLITFISHFLYHNAYCNKQRFWFRNLLPKVTCRIQIEEATTAYCLLICPCKYFSYHKFNNAVMFTLRVQTKDNQE